MSLLDSILMPVINYIQNTITDLGAFGVVLLMAIESANIPLPSEAILPFAGYLVSINKMNFHIACFAGAFGCVVGSVPSYYLGYYGGRPFVEKYGKWMLISKKDLDTADRWTKKYGDMTFFICRMLPVVRTFISVPAGVLKANFPKFVFFTFLGSLIWSYLLVYVGVKFGENIHIFKEIWHKFDYAIVAILLTLFIVYIVRHIKHVQD